MEIKLDVTVEQLKLLIGNCSDDKEIISRLIGALAQQKMAAELDAYVTEIIGWIFANANPEANERGFTILDTVYHFSRIEKGADSLTEKQIELVVNMVRDRLIGMNLIIAHPDREKTGKKDLWKFGQYHPRIFNDFSIYGFGERFSRFK